jgi:hypothetical protein
MNNEEGVGVHTQVREPNVLASTAPGCDCECVGDVAIAGTTGIAASKHSARGVPVACITELEIPVPMLSIFCRKCFGNEFALLPWLLLLPLFVLLSSKVDVRTSQT